MKNIYIFNYICKGKGMDLGKGYKSFVVNIFFFILNYWLLDKWVLYILKIVFNSINILFYIFIKVII